MLCNFFLMEKLHPLATPKKAQLLHLVCYTLYSSTLKRVNLSYMCRGIVMGEKKVSEEELVNKYKKHFDKNVAYRLLKKLRKSTRNKSAIIAGSAKAIVSTLGHLLSALDNPATPPHLKALIMGAIGYIVLPVDLIPDAIPGIGFSDDLLSASGVVLAITAYSNFSLEELDAEIDSE